MPLAIYLTPKIITYEIGHYLFPYIPKLAWFLYYTTIKLNGITSHMHFNIFCQWDCITWNYYFICIYLSTACSSIFYSILFIFYAVYVLGHFSSNSRVCSYLCTEKLRVTLTVRSFHPPVYKWRRGLCRCERVFCLLLRASWKRHKNLPVCPLPRVFSSLKGPTYCWCSPTVGLCSFCMAHSRTSDFFFFFAFP